MSWVAGPITDSGTVTLIQRFGSVANLNIHLHCLVLNGVYLRALVVPQQPGPSPGAASGPKARGSP